MSHVFFALLGSATLTAWAGRGRRVDTFGLCLMLFQLHLVLDFGSGPHWHVHYFWPFRTGVLRNPQASPF